MDRFPPVGMLRDIGGALKTMSSLEMKRNSGFLIFLTEG